MGISLLSLWLTLLWYPWPCSLKTKMFKSKSNLKHFINLLNFFLKNYFFCRKSISAPADGPWLKSIFFYSNGFLFWLRKKIMEHLSVLADIYSTHQGREYWYMLHIYYFCDFFVLHTGQPPNCVVNLKLISS